MVVDMSGPVFQGSPAEGGHLSEGARPLVAGGGAILKDGCSCMCECDCRTQNSFHDLMKHT